MLEFSFYFVFVFFVLPMAFICGVAITDNIYGTENAKKILSKWRKKLVKIADFLKP